MLTHLFQASTHNRCYYYESVASPGTENADLVSKALVIASPICRVIAIFAISHAATHLQTHKSSSAISQDSQPYCQPSLDAMFKEKYSLLLARFPQQRTQYPHHEEGVRVGVKPLRKPGRQTSHIINPLGLFYLYKGLELQYITYNKRQRPSHLFFA